jgi:hypothetical protein
MDKQLLITTVQYCMTLIAEDKQSLEAIIEHYDRYKDLNLTDLSKEHAEICAHQERLLYILDNITNGKLNG